jgi:hypothetical protein
MSRLATFLACAVLVVGFPSLAAKPKEKPLVKSIAIISATDPVLYTLETKSGFAFIVPLVATANKSESADKAKAFNEKIGPLRGGFAQRFSDKVAELLRNEGFEVAFLSNVPRPPGEPDNIDYDKVRADADAVLHLVFTEVGLYSPRSSTDYLPRVNAHAVFLKPGIEDYIYDEDIYYGVDARKGKSWAIEADPAFVYPTFEAAMSNVNEIQGRFEAAAGEIAKRLVGQLKSLVN